MILSSPLYIRVLSCFRRASSFLTPLPWRLPGRVSLSLPQLTPPWERKSKPFHSYHYLFFILSIRMASLQISPQISLPMSVSFWTIWPDNPPFSPQSHVLIGGFLARLKWIRCKSGFSKMTLKNCTASLSRLLKGVHRRREIPAKFSIHFYGGFRKWTVCCNWKAASALGNCTAAVSSTLQSHKLTVSAGARTEKKKPAAHSLILVYPRKKQ